MVFCNQLRARLKGSRGYHTVCGITMKVTAQMGGPDADLR